MVAMDETDRNRLDTVVVGEADAELVALEEALRAAQLAADVTAMDRLISDDLLFTGPDGQLGTKAQDLDAHASGLVRFRVHKVTELRVRRVGADVAICALRTWLEVDVAGQRTAGWFRYTRVWAREADTGWRVVGGHVAAVGS
jgi:ketosteroid isomerase-like protein